MRIVLTGGVTGGHIYPALAIADEFKKRDDSTQVLYIGDQEGMEKYIVPQHGYELRFVDCMYFDRSNILRIARTIFQNAKGIHQSKKILKEFKPDIIMSTGGYVSLPVIIAAKKLGIKVFIHEQNAFPGMANKFLEKYAVNLFIGFKEAAAGFQDKNKIVYTGNPVRRAFYNVNDTDARAALELNEDATGILIFGGSLGAAMINSIGEEIVRTFSNRKDVNIVFGTGKNYYDKTAADLQEYLNGKNEHIRVIPYIDDMPNALAASDIVISRAGALSVAEITVTGRAAIFVPSRNVTDNHQYFNAKTVVDAGGGYIVEEGDDTVNNVVEILSDVIDDPERMTNMQKNSKAIAPPSATKIICDRITRAMFSEEK